MCPGIYEHPFKEGKRLLGPYFYSDGYYDWDRDTWKYVVKYGLTLPQQFIDHVMSEEGTVFLEKHCTDNKWKDVISKWKNEPNRLCLLPDFDYAIPKVNEKWKLENITEFKTSVGKIIITDKNNNRIPFTVQKSVCCPVQVFAEDNERLRYLLYPKHNYFISVSPANLTIGEKYRAVFTGGRLECGDSDENTFCISGIFGKYSFAFGAYDPQNHDPLFSDIENLSSQAYAHVFSANFAADCVKNPCRAIARLRIFALSATKLCSKIRTHFL